MSAEELPHDVAGPRTEQQTWTVASISRDGTRMLLVDADGNEMSVAVAPTALPRRSEKTTVNQTPSLRPRDIQARIRSGESPESVAEAAGTSLERIMPFAAPVMAEREHMAGRAQKASVRRQATESTARTLGDAVALQLATTDGVEDAVEWDAWRRTDGRWALVALYTTAARSGAGEFTFDPPGNYVSLDNDDARWLVGDLVVEAPAAPVLDDLSAARVRRDSRDDDQPAATLAPKPTWTPAVPPLAPAIPEPVEDVVPVQEAAPVAPAAPVEAPAEPAAQAPAETVAEPVVEAPVAAPAAPKKAKRRGRASVPSWDEIMFGGAGDAEKSSDSSDSDPA
ncbi:septation protein SepH [Nocardioides sp.]|uniref:septation protein SepH n=1 Tax=Nocardioides sp. TaxID=35761 RepID=UPI002604CACF|nr:septation protein SepH [Nocardioides sp.]